MNSAADLPTKARRDESAGWVPDAGHRYTTALVDGLNALDDYVPSAGPPRLWVSDAGKCSRLLGYKLLGVDRSNPMDDAGVVNVGLGRLLHDAWQAGLGEPWQLEHRVELADGAITGRVDAWNPDTSTVLEFKSQNATGYRYAAGLAYPDRPAEGPKADHVLQAALGALALDADDLVIVYVSKETVQRYLNRRPGPEGPIQWGAEWTIDRDTWEPMATAELARLEGIAAMIAGGEVPARRFPSDELPTGAEIVDPRTGTWDVVVGGRIVDTGSWWACRYCSHQDFCASIPDSGRITSTAVALHARRAGLLEEEVSDAARE